MNYNGLIEILFKMRDEKFATFSKGLSNSDYETIGIKNTKLREFIKEYKDDSEIRLEDFELGKYLEIDFLYFGIALSRIKSINEQLDFLRNNIKLAKSWAITDCITTFLKKCSFDLYWDFFLDLYNSKFTYERRMAYVLGLKFYRDENILKVLNYINYNEEYMVMMAEAWLLATIAITFSSDVYNYLKSIDDITLKRKTISKMCDSRRIDDETKTRFKGLR